MPPIQPALNMSAKSRIGAGLFGGAIALATVLVTAHEGHRNHAYVDGANTVTICEGHTRGVKLGDVASPGQCAEYLRADMLEANAELDRCTSAQLTTNQRAAFISFAYNIGGMKFCASSIARKINSHDIKGACKAIGLYQFVAGKDCRIKGSNCGGIVKRRAEEVALCWPSFATVT